MALGNLEKHPVNAVRLLGGWDGRNGALPSKDFSAPGGRYLIQTMVTGKPDVST